MTTTHYNNDDTNNYKPVTRARRFYSVRQAAWILGVSAGVMARAVRVGAVRAVRRRGVLVVTANELARHLASPVGTETSSPADGSERTLDALDRYRDVPTGVLARIVVRDCAAPLEDLDAESDADLAERICGACRSPLACVELELRLHGENTVGVWGGLPDDTVRALCRGWRERRDHDPTSSSPDLFCSLDPVSVDPFSADSVGDENKEGWA